MANEEIRITTVLKDGGAEKTLTNLLKKINDCKKALTELDSTSQDYIGTLEELAAAQREVAGTLNGLEKAMGTVSTATTEFRDTLIGLQGKMEDCEANLGTLSGEMEGYAAGLEELVDLQGQLLDLFEEMESAGELVSGGLEMVEGMGQTTTVTMRELMTTTNETTVKYGGLEIQSRKVVQTGQELVIETQNLIDKQEALNEVNEEARDLWGDIDTAFGHLNDAMGGIDQGFQALLSITEQLGIENGFLADAYNRVQAGMQLVQSGMQLVQSFGQLMKGVKSANMAFKAFNATLLANPIILVVMAVAALVIGLASLLDTLSSNRSGVAELKAEHEDFLDTLEQSSEAHDFNRRMMEAEEASQQKLIQADIDHTRSQMENTNLRLQSIKAEIAAIESRNLGWFQGNRKRLAELKEQEEQLNGMIEAQAASLAKLEGNLQVQIKKDEVAAAKERQKQAEAAHKKRQKEQEKFNDTMDKIEQERLDRQKEQQREEEEAMMAEMDMEERLAYMKTEKFRAMEDEIAKTEELIALKEQEMNDETLSYEQRTAAALAYQEAMRERYELDQTSMLLREEARILEEEIEIAEQERQAEEEARFEEEKQRMAELAGLEREIVGIKNPEQLTHREKVAQKQEEIDLKQQEIDKMWEVANNEKWSLEERQEALENYKKAKVELDELEAELTDLQEGRLERMLDKTKKTLEDAAEKLGENTVAGKAAAVAAATIDTFKSANAAYASMAGIPIVGPALGAGAAAAAIATGLKTVQSIVKTKVPDANDSVTASASATDVSAAMPSMPEMTGQVQETHNNMDANDEDRMN